jgi:CheY-like chemotaxis protein
MAQARSHASPRLQIAITPRILPLINSPHNAALRQQTTVPDVTIPSSLTDERSLDFRGSTTGAVVSQDYRARYARRDLLQQLYTGRYCRCASVSRIRINVERPIDFSISGVRYACPYREEGAMNASILVADDEPNIVLSLEFLLKQAGFRVRTVSDGEAALAAIAQEPPDLVLLDIMIPGRNGFAVCQEIRSNPAWEHIRIIMLTAKGGEIQREKGLSLGADEYVTKPFSNRDLVERIRRVLQPPK